MYMAYKNSTATSQKTYYVSITNTNQLLLFTEMIAVYCKNNTKHMNTTCGQNAQVSGDCNIHNLDPPATRLLHKY